MSNVHVDEITRSATQGAADATAIEGGPTAQAVIRTARGSGKGGGRLTTLDQLDLQYKSEAYTFLQLVVGIIAVALPLGVWAIDRIIDGQHLRGSISHYYYGRSGGVFVGSLCALAVFFLAYDYRPRPGFEADNRLSNVAAAAAAAVALFPTAYNLASAGRGQRAVATVHIVSAVVLFGCLAVFSLWHFTKSSIDDNVSNSNRWTRLKQQLPRIYKYVGTEAKGSLRRRKNVVHRACGWLIVASMLFIAVNNAVGWHLMFGGEAAAVEAFGVSWLVKSDWIAFLQTPEVKAAKGALKAERTARKERLRHHATTIPATSTT